MKCSASRCARATPLESLLPMRAAALRGRLLPSVEPSPLAWLLLFLDPVEWGLARNGDEVQGVKHHRVSASVVAWRASKQPATVNKNITLSYFGSCARAKLMNEACKRHKPDALARLSGLPLRLTLCRMFALCLGYSCRGIRQATPAERISARARGNTTHQKKRVTSDPVAIVTLA
jgi:hypothetical protein